MIIKTTDRVLLLRFTNYRHYDFINEHIAVIKSLGSVWMLKAGKEIPETRIRGEISSLGAIILKAPKSSGGQYYIAEVETAYNGVVKQGMAYPLYYNDIIDDENFWQMDSLKGTWIKITSLKMLGDIAVNKLALSSNGKNVSDVLNSTRSSVVYVSPVVDLEV